MSDDYEREGRYVKENGKNVKRSLALLLCGAMLLGSTACGTADAGEEAPAGTENAAGAAAGAASGGTEKAGEETAQDEAAAGATALSVMQEFNTAQPQISQDNYRTWYEVFVYSFYDGDGDGIGDLAGLTEKLDYINDGDPATDTDLGCDGIWLMPVMPSTTYHKYDVTDYCAIDSEYGTMEDFDAFVEACHERGIHVIIDLVMNHSSTQHEWFQTAAEYLRNLPEGAEPDAAECPYVDYYHFSRENGGGYCELDGTDWYYEAQFWSEMPDLNLDSEAVREEFAGIVDFWLDKGVDGFRLDAAKEYESGNIEGNVEILSWFNTMVKEKKDDAYIVAEVWNDLPTYAQYYESGIDSCFDFAFADKDGIIASAVKGSSGAAAYGKALVNLQETIAPYSDSYIDAPFYTNHDMGRSAGYYSGDYSENQTKIGQALNLLMSGSSFLYYGEELGMKGSGKDENKRAPMYWSMDEGTAGMCKGPADMDDIKMKYDSLAEQQEDGDSIYSFVKEAIKLRNSYPAITHGTVTYEESLSDASVCVITKAYMDEEVVLVINLSEETKEVDLSQMGATEICGALLTTAEAPVLTDGTLTLPQYSVVVLQ
ncbi:MAG: DUF3459 domain-containing protein [Roseburia sp.]|nr:DUF3459 domain-containing protein [Roseburia sp.]